MTWQEPATLIGSAYCLVFGLMIGSFISLATDRLPRGESLLAPRSYCRACGRVLNAIDLFPVAGYILRGGRCASCREPIGVASPITEMICGVLMAGPTLLLGIWPGAAAGVALVAAYGTTMTALAIQRRRTRKHLS
jgi:prepilin signal peptidase PulO-like enzyme (type II secretory pathway)